MRKWLLAGIALLVLAGSILLSGKSVLTAMGQWLVVEAPLRETDLVVALGGDRFRQDEAVKILKNGLAKWILFVGSDVTLRDYHCAEVPAGRTLPPPEPVYTTYEEALAVRKVVQERRLTSVIVVTSPYHLRRTRWTFDRVFQGSAVVLLTTAAPNNAFQMDTWWTRHIGRKLVLSEYLALAYYWIAY